MRAWAKRLAFLAVPPLALLAVAGAVFLARPGALLTSRTVGAAIKVLGASYAPAWSSLRFSAEALSLRRHRYALTAFGFCVADRPGVFSACFSELELRAVVFYSRRGPVVERVERLVAVSGGARVDLRRRGPGGGAGGPPAALYATPVRELRVELSSFTFTTSTAAVAGDFRAVVDPRARRPLSAAADLRVAGFGDVRRLKAELSAATDLLQGGAPTFVDLVGSADLRPGGRARADFRARRDARGYAASGAAEVSPSTGPLRSLRLYACEGSAPLGPGAQRPSAAGLACRYQLTPAGTPAGPFRSLRSLTGRVSLDGRAGGGTYEAALKADVEPVKAWYEVAGSAAVRASGRLDRPLKDAALAHEVRATVKVPRFEDLVALLKETKYAVPAPFHVLKGPLSLAIGSRGDPRAARLSARYELARDLAAGRQRLVLRAKGEAAAADAGTPGRALEHSGELIFKEVALEVPRLEVGRAPKVFVDKRIKTGGEARDGAAPGRPAAGRAGPRLAAPRGRLVVKTEKPVVLFLNLAKDPVPIGLDLVLTSPPSAAAGRVSVRAFDVELFRRNATIDHLNIEVSSGSRPGALEGLVRYKTPDVEIRIMVLGTVEKPLIELASVPPLKREDIIALLIFGKSPAELDPEQTASVSNTETALESRAFGLASLYLFGATPIEHVGYDSATKTTTVKLRLPGGANLTIGSDFDQSRQLTLRKSLAPHWAIQSEISDQGREGAGATTFLEWFNRY
ncbi:MAG: translocation/assembly module TamB domain-containing protein [Elusimicrobia bacterium]|nr:translocation/assembly module TamB domain-containing protein [Elusimicrobiota bacterium]